MRILRTVTALLLAMLFFSASVAATPEARIETISVQVRAEEGASLAEPVAKRMQASVHAVADNVLTGRTAAEIAERRAGYETLIGDIFDRILMGYSVRSVAVRATDTRAEIEVVVVGWQETCRSVTVETQIEQAAEEVRPLIESDIQGVERVFEKILLHLPVDAMEWTNGIVKQTLSEFLDEQLPEFRGDFEIVAGVDAKIKLYLYPKGTLIRDINVSLRSETIPNLLLVGYSSAVARQADPLVGLPAAFVQRHKDDFLGSVTEKIAQDSALHALKAEVRTELKPGASTEIVVRVETSAYNLFVEGYLDLGRKEDNASILLHGGKYLSPLDELFLEIDFVPGSVKWRFMPGYARKITPRLIVGAKYALSDQEAILWAKQKVGERWLVRVERTPRRQYSEFALRYTMHDYIGVEYVFADNANWLRLVGNF